MRKFGTWSWPILMVSDQLRQDTDQGAWLRGIVECLTDQRECTVQQSHTLADASDAVRSQEHFGAIVLDWDISEIGQVRARNRDLRVAAAADGDTRRSLPAETLVSQVRQRNTQIPIVVLMGAGLIEDLPPAILRQVDEVIWKLTDTPEFNAGRIERACFGYVDTVLPPFFRELVAYVNEYKFAWHTPGHMGGQAFLRSPAGTAFHAFFGEDLLRADLSISVPDLGSLLDHSGLAGEAERYSAGVFGADQTFYVLNGTSTANQIIWRSRVLRDDPCLMDRNCHKSLSHAMVITGAKPSYMLPLRNGLGLIGPVDFRTVPDPGTARPYAMAALTNSTYDGICYDVREVAGNRLPAKLVDALHFDEAWFGYARFHPLYEGRYAMSISDEERLVFASQSTHKVLAALSQASMIHVRLPESARGTAPEQVTRQERFHELFNESYMMHGSTSPQYNMIASLEVATKMMADNGQVTSVDNLRDAVDLRRDMARTQREILSEDPRGWFFQMWQPEEIGRAFDTRSEEEDHIEALVSQPEHWILRPGDSWHGFDNLPGDYAMLDPIKLTFLCPGLDVHGQPRLDLGVPAAIVTNYLIGKGIVCEKTDYYSWLLLNTLGTTRGKQATLVAELLRFKQLFDDRRTLLKDVFPALVKDHPEAYPENTTLRGHCYAMHRRIMELDLVSRLRNATATLPKFVMSPADAYRAVVEDTVETVRLDELVQQQVPRTAAVMVVPYPPGIPMVMGGEAYEASSPVLDYLIARQDFEYEFPGYDSDTHGISRTTGNPPAGETRPKAYFQTMVVK